MTPSTYKFLADALVVFHFAFVAFVMTGAFLVLRWRRVMWLHLPAVAWGIWIELSGGTCPLTPLENQLLKAGGEASYTGSFVDHYIVPVLYPDGLTRNLQYAIAAVIVLINGTCYGYLLWRRRRDRRAQSQEQGREGAGTPTQVAPEVENEGRAAVITTPRAEAVEMVEVP